MPSTTTMKQSLATAVLAALPLATRAQGTTPPKVAAACNDVAIFMARGNDAPYHDGRTSPFIDATCGKFQAQGNSCDYMDIVFDATLGVEFCPTIQEGAVNGIRQITEYNAQCPDTLIVINGYSQGGMVSGALLSGGGEDACNVDSQTLGLDPTSQAGQAVKAALLWGDVKHTANQPYNVLDGADKQAWPRTGANLERLNRYSAVLRSYCAAGDPVCANGDVIAQHLNYFELYTEEASSWVVSKLTPLLVKASSSAVPSSSVAPAPSSTAIPEDSTTVVTSTETSTMEVPVTVTKGAVKPSTMISSYVPVTIPHKHYNATAPYNNFTMPVSSTVMTADKPHETTYLPVEESHAPATTKAPEYSAVAAACPPATVYETVTNIVTKYV
ncbi:hypothetical protein AA0118_g8202 [Alternaria tenuissima]|nr:hypothetical protein AA0118_g8202 [Alternaria tenuissima]RYO52274.1 hypothetical protein AA0116_g11196 [Alternaria tenuissima]